MKYGFCTDIRFLDGDSGSRTVLDALAEAGFDYVELPFAPLSACEKTDELKKILRAANLPCLACNMFFPPALKLVGSRDAAGIRAYLERMLPFAADMGVQTLVFGNGGARKIPPGETREAVWEHLRFIAEEMEKHAGAAGVKITVEPLNTKETDMVNSYTEAVKLTEGLRHVAAMIDSYHVLMAQQDYADVLQTPERVWHLHTAYSAKRLVPSQESDMPELTAFAQTIKQIEYNGKISIEGALRADKNNAAAVKAEIKNALGILKSLYE